MSAIPAAAQSAPSSSLKGFIIRHPLVAYFAMAFAFAWICQIPLLLAQNGFGLLPWTLPKYLFTIPAVLAGPWLSAFVVTAAADGKAGVRQLLRGYVRWRVGIRWYLLALLFYPGLLFLETSLVFRISPVDLFSQLWPLLFSVFLPGILEALVVAQLWEEVGWRGFALPRLQRRFGPLWGTLILGTLWACWHVPGFFYAGGASEGTRMAFTVVSFIQFFTQELIGFVFLSMLFTWVYNNTRASLLLIIIFHTVATVSLRPFVALIPLETFLRALGPLSSATLLLLAAALVLGTRGRLGYKGEGEA